MSLLHLEEWLSVWGWYAMPSKGFKSITVSDDVYDYAVEQTGKIASGDEPYHDDLMDVMTGKKQSGQQFDDAYKKRKI